MPGTGCRKVVTLRHKKFTNTYGDHLWKHTIWAHVRLSRNIYHIYKEDFDDAHTITFLRIASACSVAANANADSAATAAHWGTLVLHGLYSKQHGKPVKNNLCMMIPSCHFTLQAARCKDENIPTWPQFEFRFHEEVGSLHLYSHPPQCFSCLSLPCCLLESCYYFILYSKFRFMFSFRVLLLVSSL